MLRLHSNRVPKPKPISAISGDVETEKGRPDDPAAKGYFRVWYGTNRRPVDGNKPDKGFTAERDITAVHYGSCRVFIPHTHKIGSLGSPWWKRLWMWKDDRLRIASLKCMDDPEKFWRAIAAHLAPLRASERQALIFIHVFNVSFNDAALRAAQIGFDLGMQGAMAFFSWPSKGTLKGYAADEATIGVSETAITNFIYLTS